MLNIIKHFKRFSALNNGVRFKTKLRIEKNPELPYRPFKISWFYLKEPYIY